VATIVEQIQHDALDPKIPVSSLLRRVKFAAAKLGLGSVESWVGYDGYVP
jgi:AbiTii-like protein